MQAVAKAKDQIKKFRRRESSMSQSQGQGRRSSVGDDLPPPYSENPPFNPFFNDLVHNVSNTSFQSDLDITRSPQDRSATIQDLDGGHYPGGVPADRLSPLYPVLPHIPPYSPPHAHGDSQPPGFVTTRVARRSQFGRRDSFQSDSEQDQAATRLANIKLQSEQQQKHK